MGRKARTYSDEFKAEVIEAVRDGGVDERDVAEQRSVAVSTVRRWLRQAAAQAEYGFEDSEPDAGTEEPGPDVGSEDPGPDRGPEVSGLDAAPAAPFAANGEALRHRAFLEALRRLLDAVESEVDETKTFGQLEAAVAAVMEVTASRDASILARDESTGDMFFVVCRGVLPPEDLLWKRVPPGHGIVQWVADQRRSVTINDVTHDPRFFGEIDSETGFRTRNLMAAPLERDGRVLGVIEVLNKADRALYTVEDLGHLRLMAAHLAALLARLA